MAKWPLVGHDGALIEDGAQKFVAFGGSLQSTTEATVQQEVRDTYTASNLRVYISLQSGDNSAVTFRLNAGDGNQIVSITGTGEFEDTSNTDSLVSGDLICVDLDAVAGMHGDSFTVETYQTTLDASSDVPPIMAASTWGADNDFAALQGAFDDQATETDVEYTMRATRTLRDLRIYASAHTGGSDSAITIRKNQADTSLTVTVTGTGEFLDTSNTASFVAGDEANYGASDVATASTTTVRSVEADTSSGVQMYGDDAVFSGVNFFAPSAFTTSGITEVEAQIEAEDAATIQNLFVNCFTYAETRTIRTRKNAANGAASVSVSGTGIFEDTSNTDSLVAEDDLSIQQDAGSSGSNGYLIAVEWETGVAGPTFTRSLAGSQPNSTGTLGAGRLLTGEQPNATGTLARVEQALRALAGDQPNATGALTRVEQALRALAGDQPNATGTLGAGRLLVGDQPNATGTLARIEKALRAVAGNQPNATGALTRIEQAVRALTGSQPNAVGALVRVEQALRALAGDQPNATGTLAAELTTTRALAGSQPNATGTLTRIEKAVRALVGDQPNATGALTRIEKAVRALAGDQPNAAGTLTRVEQAVRALAGDQPNAVGAIARVEQAVRALAGDQPNATGTLTHDAAGRALAGDQPNATGALTRVEQAVRALAGNQPNATGSLTAGRLLTGDQPNATGTLARVAQPVRALAGDQPAGAGVLVRVEQAVRVLAGDQPAATGVLTRDAQAPTFSDYGEWRALINPADYQAGTAFYFEAILATSNAAFPSFARLFNITDAAAVAGSEVQSADSDSERVRSAALTLAAGDKEYRAERGGFAGGALYKCFSANVIAQSS